ncbi:MAG: cobyric acid synthase [Firmicutes bacterium]|nr:cobyric acid synthase [Bacillota bacterium]
MAKSLMIQGTCSNAGKSLLTAGLLRIFTQDGYNCAPFKSQNMALNSYITPEGFEMGRAQVMQAEACRKAPDVRMNPILLKPTGDMGSQVIVNGEVTGNQTAAEYYKTKHALRQPVMEAYRSLAEENDIIVIEGAGSPAEINLMEDDIVNMGMAAMADAPVIIAGDIDRGGVFASLAGTMMLLKDEDRPRVKGVIINKFRGDVEILRPGLEMLEDIIKVPVLGVVPYMKVDVDDEDSLSSKLRSDKGVDPVDVAVIRLPRISNFTDFDPLERVEGIGVRYVNSVHELGDPDLVIIPGTKNTMGDLEWMRESGLEAQVKKYASKGKPVFGICGGYQILGRTISDPGHVEHGGTMRGMELLPIDTVFAGDKVRAAEEGMLSAVDGAFSGLSGLPYRGYEIHMGVSGACGNIINSGNVYGTYIHGIFDKEEPLRAVAEALFRAKGLDPDSVRAMDADSYKQEQYDILADELRKALDMDKIYEIVGLKGE